MDVPDPERDNALAWLLTQADLDRLPRLRLGPEAQRAPLAVERITVAGEVPDDEVDDEQAEQARALLGIVEGGADDLDHAPTDTAGRLSAARGLLGRAQLAERTLAEQQDAAEAQADALRAEVARLSALADDEHAAAVHAEARVESMRGKRDRAREHAVRAERERDEARALTEHLGQQLDEAREHLARYEQHGALVVPGDLLDPRHTALDDDPRRPHPAANAWPDDAVTLTYGELRQLAALHLDHARQGMPGREPWVWLANRAAAVRDGEAPLLLAEVLTR